MTKLFEMLDMARLADAMAEGYVKRQFHPTQHLAIYNYTAKCQYDQAWTEVTRACRGIIIETDTGKVIARPWPKFHNYGEHEDGTLDLSAPVEVTDKLDGSLGILYPSWPVTAIGPEWAIATRGSFTSEQAMVATRLLHEQAFYRDIDPELTYLFEILYPGNRIVVDYGNVEALRLIGGVVTATGEPLSPADMPGWVGTRVEVFEAETLSEALLIEPRPNCEGVVVRYLVAPYAMVKIKQADYVALHRILTGTNARNVWEVVAVQTCEHLIKERKHWGTFLGIDPARAEEVLALGDDWLDDVPDEFHEWVKTTTYWVAEVAMTLYVEGCRLADSVREIEDRKERYERVADSVLVKEVMRVASAKDSQAGADALGGLLMRCWREACPEPTSPFARTEDVA